MPVPTSLPQSLLRYSYPEFLLVGWRTCFNRQLSADMLYPFLLIFLNSLCHYMYMFKSALMAPFHISSCNVQSFTLRTNLVLLTWIYCLPSITILKCTGYLPFNATFTLHNYLFIWNLEILKSTQTNLMIYAVQCCNSFSFFWMTIHKLQCINKHISRIRNAFPELGTHFHNLIISSK